MRSIKLNSIKIAFIFSFFFFQTNVQAQDYVNDQIDYAACLISDDAMALFIPAMEKETKEILIPKTLKKPVTPKSVSIIPTKVAPNITSPKTRQMYGRESITFILGEDQDPANPFYEDAFFYFSNHPYDRTEYIITSCQSLLDVRNYLAAYPTFNALPWSTINIVMSPNESMDLRVPIFPQGLKSDVPNLKTVTAQNDFPSLSSNQVDQRTSLYIHGAEVKKDSKLNYALHALLFAKEKVAVTPIFLDDSFTLRNN